MKTFKKLYKALTINNKDNSVIIYKVQKEWTKRTFFALENTNWEKLSSTMFARLYDAKKLALKLV